MAAAQPAAQPPSHIQITIDKEIASIPIFYGNYKDTETLSSYIARIDQGISALHWSEETAFTFFSNSVKGRARAWLDCYLTDNPLLPRRWIDFKPFFRKAFGDVSDPIVLAQELCNIKLEQHGNCLYTYYAEITKAVNLHQEKFITPPPQPAIPADLVMDEDQIEYVGTIYRQTHSDAVRAIHTTLRREFFLNGLPKKLLDLVAHKTHLQTVNDMIEYLHQQEMVERKKNGNGSQPTAHHSSASTSSPIHTISSPPNAAAENTTEEIAANTRIQPSNYRGNNYRNNYRGNTNNYRGNYNRGGYDNNNRGGYRPNGQNFQNTNQNAHHFQTAGQKQTTGPSKTCIYCRRIGHIQDFCRDRMNKGDPCIDSQGRGYFPNPKVNVGAAQEVSATSVGATAHSNSVFFLEN